MVMSTSYETIEKSVRDWVSIMTDPYFDGFTGWGQKQKLYLLKELVDGILADPNLPKYAGEKEWLEEMEITL